jgi:hypothetical protein
MAKKTRRERHTGGRRWSKDAESPQDADLANFGAECRLKDLMMFVFALHSAFIHTRMGILMTETPSRGSGFSNLETDVALHNNTAH